MKISFSITITAGSVLALASCCHAALRGSDTPAAAGRELIVGGTDAALNEFPSFGYPGVEGPCGATLIHDDILVSAAHCSGAFPIGGNMHFGGVNDYWGSDAQETLEIEQVLIHPQYDDNDVTRGNDIMMIKLRTPSTTAGRPVVYNFDPSTPRANEVVTVVGYGGTSSGGQNSDDQLLKANLNIVGPEFARDCRNPNLLCANADGRDACQGDSGGPLYNEQGSLVGIVSYGIGCGDVNFPAVFTRVSAYDDFIFNAICDMSSNAPDDCF